MKTISSSVLKKPYTQSSWRSTARQVLGILSWLVLVFLLLLTGIVLGWILLALFRLGTGPSNGVLPVALVLVGITGAFAWLVAKKVSTIHRVRQVAGITLLVIFGVEAILAAAYPDDALFFARQIAWGDSDLRDYEHFPERLVNNAAPVFYFTQAPSPDLFQIIEYTSEGQIMEADFEEFLKSTQTTSFIVIKDDAVVYEGYFNGYSRDSIVTSFSMAKSVTSALIGIAMDEGYIGGVSDLVIHYIPELKGKGFDELTLCHLLDMSSGIQFIVDEELPPLAELTQYTDSGLSYSYPNLRNIALRVKADGEPLGALFNYNNYNTILLGMILERTTGRPVAEYLQEKIWKPLGMEFPASWSLDSEKSGFELMGGGVNARAIDFAKFGRLFLNNGRWNSSQIISEQWIKESTSPDPADQRIWHSDSSWKEDNGYYKYQWWGKVNPDGSYAYAAQGHRGQRIYISPKENVIIVRFGFDEGGVDDWFNIFQDMTSKLKSGTAPSSMIHPGLPTSTPEENGFDSSTLAEGLLAIDKKGTKIHSLLAARNDSVFLDAVFYPLAKDMIHDQASVTKSVMTTLIGIAADRGKLKLDQSILDFFPTRTIANPDGKDQITVRHLVSMSSGLDCTPQGNERTLREMWASPDWVQFILDRRAIYEPGTHFSYCSPGMHLLSVILTEATGMTALEFAQEYLFTPLAIEQSYWPIDSQGYNHGWGDLCLSPQAMAKLGILFANRGRWNDQQIVSAEWVDAATKLQISTGQDYGEDYGYGWWIGRSGKEPEFLATGNGGQKIKVYPRLGLVVVTTGSGFEFSEIEPYFVSSIVDLENALPPNPSGVEQLRTAITSVANPPAAQDVPPLPKLSLEISGKVFKFQSNPLDLNTLSLNFDSPDEAVYQFDQNSVQTPIIGSIGLDGLYRSSRSGPPVLAKGSWTDEQTFTFEYNDGPGVSVSMMTFRFEGDLIHFTLNNAATSNLIIEGQLIQP